MNRQPHSAQREVIVAEAIREFVSELRLVELADYVAYLRLERFANVSDIVESAAELYFMPGTVRLGGGGEVHLGWSGEPRIALDLELRPRGASVYFTLSLSAETAGVEVNYVAFDKPDDDPHENTLFLQAALEGSRLRKTVGMGV